jgi:hypothetical protein
LPLAPAFAAFGFTKGIAPLFAVGNKKPLSPHRAQNARLLHFFAKAFEQLIR